MTDEQMRIAIAEALGYTHVRIIKDIEGPPDAGIGHHPTKPHSVPDYLNDLNAMHEAEKAAGFHANTSEGRKLTQKYAHLIGAECESWKGYATARQRAEAFLKTKGIIP